MRQYRLSFNAKEDLRRIYWFGVNVFGEQQADKYYIKLTNKIEQIALNPFQYQQIDHIRRGYRRALCGSDTIYFKLTDECVDIMAIIGGQDTDDWL